MNKENCYISWIDVFYLKHKKIKDITKKVKLRNINLRVSVLSPELNGVCYLINKDIFNTVSEDITLHYLKSKIKKSLYPPNQNDLNILYNAKNSGKRKEEFNWLLKLIQEQYNWSNNELNECKDYYLEQFKDIENLKYYFKFFGVKNSYWKKYINE